MQITEIKINHGEGALIVSDIDLGILPKSHAEGIIIAAGPVIKECAMSATRRAIIWQDKEGNYVTHYQYFPHIHKNSVEDSYLSDGGYHGKNLGAAIRIFSHRIGKLSDYTQRFETPAA